MKRTVYNCSLIKKMDSTPRQLHGHCEGFASTDRDEPCDTCKKCKTFCMDEEGEK